MSVLCLCICQGFDGAGVKQFQRKILRQKEQEISSFSIISGQGFLLPLKLLGCWLSVWLWNRGKFVLTFVSSPPFLVPSPAIVTNIISSLHNPGDFGSFTWTRAEWCRQDITRCSQDNHLCFCSWDALMQNVILLPKPGKKKFAAVKTFEFLLGFAPLKDRVQPKVKAHLKKRILYFLLIKVWT